VEVLNVELAAVKVLNEELVDFNVLKLVVTELFVDLRVLNAELVLTLELYEVVGDTTYEVVVLPV